MDVNQNFERLEQEVTRLMDVLEKLRGENTGLKERVQSLESEIGIFNAENERLKQIESAYAESTAEIGRLKQIESAHAESTAEVERLKQIESAHQESNRGKEEIKGRIENILSRLDGLDL